MVVVVVGGGGGVVGVVAVVMFALLFEVFLLSLPFILLLFFAGASVGFAVGFADCAGRLAPQSFQDSITIESVCFASLHLSAQTLGHEKRRSLLQADCTTDHWSLRNHLTAPWMKHYQNLRIPKQKPGMVTFEI